MLLCHAKAATTQCAVQKMPCVLRICCNSFGGWNVWIAERKIEDGIFAVSLRFGFAEFVQFSYHGTLASEQYHIVVEHSFLL